MLKYFSFLILLLAFSCHPPQKSNNNVDKIVFNFRDASVAPQYHKSYTITVTSEKAEIAVNSYNKDLGKGENKIKTEDWKALVDQCSKLQKPGEYIAEGATGTKGYSIVQMSKGKETYRLYWDSLSDKNITKESQNVVEKIKSLAPSLSDVLKDSGDEK